MTVSEWPLALAPLVPVLDDTIREETYRVANPDTVRFVHEFNSTKRKIWIEMIRKFNKKLVKPRRNPLSKLQEIIGEVKTFSKARYQDCGISKKKTFISNF